jgi:hypothetical protein
MRLVRLFFVREARQSVTRHAPAWGPEKPNEAREEGCDDGFPARPEGEKMRFAAEKLEAEGRRVSRAHGGDQRIAIGKV